MRTPCFWKNKKFFSSLLVPFGWAYGAATALKINLSHPFKAGCPVICVGNITAGGTGKTPVSIALAEMLKDFGKTPYFISRGYGGRLQNIIVDPNIHTPQECGDEPLLLAETAPTAVNSNRCEAAQLALQNGANVLIMDDGFQNPGLYKDLSFLVFNGTTGLGNNRLIPAGPLRESLGTAVKRAHAIIILGDDITGIEAQINSTFSTLKQNNQINLGNEFPIFHGKTKAIKPKAAAKPVLAFAGIGYPQKLYHSLQDCGLKVAQTFDFPDHHFYTRQELENLIVLADNNGWDIYTTSKDYVKIPADMRKKFKVLKIKIEWEDENGLRAFLMSKLSKFSQID